VEVLYIVLIFGILCTNKLNSLKFQEGNSKVSSLIVAHFSVPLCPLQKI